MGVLHSRLAVNVLSVVLGKRELSTIGKLKEERGAGSKV